MNRTIRLDSRTNCFSSSLSRCTLYTIMRLYTYKVYRVFARSCVIASSFTTFSAHALSQCSSDKLARAKRSRTHDQAVVVAPLKKVSLCLITVSLRQASALTSPLFHTLIYTDCAAKIDRLASVSCCFDERTNYSGSQVSFRSGTSF